MRAITWVKERGAEFAEVSLGGASLRAAGVAVSADPLFACLFDERAKLLALDHRLTSANAELHVAALHAEGRGSLSCGTLPEARVQDPGQRADDLEGHDPVQQDCADGGR